MRRGRATAPVVPEDVADAAIGRFLDYRDRGHDEATARTWALWDIHEDPSLDPRLVDYPNGELFEDDSVQSRPGGMGPSRHP